MADKGVCLSPPATEGNSPSPPPGSTTTDEIRKQLWLGFVAGGPSLVVGCCGNGHTPRGNGTD